MKKSSQKQKIKSLALSLLTIIVTVVFIQQKTSFESSAYTITGTTYYVSPTGSDNYQGTSAQPFKTFSFAMSKLIPGDGLILKNGIYTEQLRINKFGTNDLPITIMAENQQQAIISTNTNDSSSVLIQGDNIILDGIQVSSSGRYCIENEGENVTIQNTKNHHCYEHGIHTNNINSKIIGNEVYLSNQYNKDKKISSGWGSAIKVKIGGNNALVSNNLVYNNYGEGIAVTRGVNANITQNVAYDNYSVNIYVDNSKSVKVDSNLSYCTSNSGFEKNDGTPASAYGMEEEYYDNWGAQLENVSFINNIGYGCYRGIYYWRSNVSGIGLENVTIAHNTFVNMTRGSIYLEHTQNDVGNVIANNIFYQENNTFGYIENLQGYAVKNNIFNIKPGSWTLLDQPSHIYSSSIGFVSTPSPTNVDTFKLSSVSPAINRGASGDVFIDYFQTVRDSQPDIGAHEYGGNSSGSYPSPTSTPIFTPTPTSTPILTPYPTSTPNSTSSPSPTPTLVPAPTYNENPSFLTNSLSKIRQNNSFSVFVTAKDSNKGDILTMSAQNLPTGTALHSCTQTYNKRRSREELKCTFSGTISTKGSYFPKFSALDNHGGFHSQEIKITVR